MELWIRSQDRKNLIEVRALYTDIPSDFGQEGFGVYCDKRDNYVSNTLLKIGQYKTKERALEVLDEIQDIIKLKQSWQLDENSFKVCIQKSGYDEEQVMKIMDKMYVYQMPKE